MKKIIIAISIVGLFFSYSCSDDFLDRSNPNELVSSTYWQTKDDAEMALIGCYDALQQGGLYSTWPDGSGFCSPKELDCATDDGFYTWTHFSANAIAENSLSATSPLVKEVWKACYSGIARCNEVIYFVSKMGSEKISQTDTDKIVGEAKFLRAYFYHYLTSLYRDVPLSLEPTTTGHIAKSNKAEIVKYITEELEAVANSNAIPPTISANERGRISNGTIYALLCRIYLYNEMYSEAAAAANKVIISSNYGIASSYPALFSEAGNTSNEIIFSVRYDASIDGEKGFLSLCNAWVWGPVNWVLPYSNLINDFYYKDGKAINDPTSTYKDPTIFENRDPRLSYNIITPGTVWAGWPVDESGPSKGYYFRKYTQDDWEWFDSQDYYIIRYADVLLMRAEALTKTNGSKTEIMDLIDQVRQRSDVMMPKVKDAEGANLTHEQLLDVIKHERRVEFAYEGFRYFDLLRWKDLDKAFARARTEGIGGSHTFNGAKSYVWPIPQSEIDNNPIVVQAPEWGGK